MAVSYVEIEETAFQIGLDENVFSYSYNKPYYYRGIDIYRQSFFNLYKDPKISFAELDDDGVFRIYSTEGKLVYELGEPCFVRGHCTLTLEPTDAYLEDDFYKVGGTPLTYDLVIRNALGRKFYFPPHNTTTAN